jgi:2-hydroxy-3-keto-5-methylthiopentenyl-1-phosphate phosphatase
MAVHATPADTRTDLSRLLVALDYDGTVTDREYNVLAFQRFTGDAWRVFEDAVERGEMSHAECLDRQVGLLTVSKRELLAANSDEVRLASGFAGFLEALVAGGARVAVVSAGYREAIERLWRRENLPPVTLFASEIVPRNGAAGPPWAVTLDPRLGDCPTCGPGACKAGVLRRLRRVGDAVAVFGDGVSDLCLAREAHIVFARGVLAELCEREGIAYHRLRDYRLALAQLTEWMTLQTTTP